MPEIKPDRFFRFAAENSDLLSSIYYRSSRISEAELLSQIRSHAQPTSPASAYVFEQLLALGFMEQSPAATADYEMTLHFKNLLGMLLREFRLTSVRVIQAYVDSLQQLGTELSEVIVADNDTQVVRVLNEANDHIERLRQDSRNNRDAIVAESVRIKSNIGQVTVRERFAGIMRLWNTYIIPLRDMIDESKILDATLDELDRILRWSASEKQHDSILSHELQGTGSRLQRMRRDVAQDFHESLQEISPLYHDLQRDTRLVRGAVMALERTDRKGSGKLNMPERLALPVWRMEGQLDDIELRAYLHAVNGYEATAPKPLREASSSNNGFYIQSHELTLRIDQNLPIDDAWAWLICEYPQASTSQILKAQGWMREGDLGKVHFSPVQQNYLTDTHIITAFPMKVT
jgi:hypothetical protein